VPDAPTSQGENLRVLPEPFQRLPEEQILQPHRRQRQLFQGDAISEWLTEADRELLRMALLDLSDPREAQELGTALFLDRPLGHGKHVLEPDATPLLSYEAFSRSIAEQRLQFLTQHGDVPSVTLPTPQGIPVNSIKTRSRPGVVSLADPLQVAEDFVFLRTTAPSAERLWRLYRFDELRRRFRLEGIGPQKRMLLLGGTGRSSSALTVYDADLWPRMELQADLGGRGYLSRAGVEYPAHGLRVVSVWEDETSAPIDLMNEDLRLHGTDCSDG
jgi:hypothetical protein